MPLADAIDSAKGAGDIASGVESLISKKRKLDNNSEDSGDSTDWKSLSNLIGVAAPKFHAPALLPDGSFGDISLESFHKKYVVLIFYSHDFDSKCSETLNSFSDRHTEFTSENSELLFCSTDSEYVHYNWVQMDRLDGGVVAIAVPILSDRSRMVSRYFGVLCENSGQALDGLFIIDKDCVIRSAIVNNSSFTWSVDEVLRLLRETKAVDEINKS
ncbi:thioredoxin-like protein [Coemansia reversa NRRL 1564]|uniref:Thioredoxin-like protein n=1 Tax=Coemansia reversa (strain ATCC 12441 / NRRL 1564) TaxID=763665 RepID=A0A2G5BAK1_COERN|nr:thioredoxin-like protein [Coemansia reversa NRRL 1564]|eukprot:PIA15747.1 thioredoxin-like protein [Coemansia reversa NRRL 1564]